MAAKALDSGVRSRVLELDGQEVRLEIRKHPRARRMTLRIDGVTRGLRLVLPPRTALSEGLAFAERNSSWIRGQLAALPPHVPFAEGSVIPILGYSHVIQHHPVAKRGVWQEAGSLCVSGHADHLARRVQDYLKREARREIVGRARDKAARIDRKPGRIALRDTVSRWGSCSANGDMSFSWRLILAPEAVLDYIVAHEVAHLVEMNHGKRFWKLTRQLTEDVGGPQAWLRKHGTQLLQYG